MGSTSSLAGLLIGVHEENQNSELTMRGYITKWRGSFGFITYAGQDFFAHMQNFTSGSVPELHSYVEFRLGPPVKQGQPYQAVHIKVIQRASEVLADFERRAGINALAEEPTTEIELPS
jgi:hypothetical protein